MGADLYRESISEPASAKYHAQKIPKNRQNAERNVTGFGT